MAWLDTKALTVFVCSLSVAYCSCPQPVAGQPDPPCCQKTYGIVNTYTPIDECRRFKQTAPGYAPGIHQCPLLHLFSTRTCRCELPKDVNCHSTGGAGGWGQWMTKTSCIGQCGSTGYMEQTRACDNPQPSGGGKYCQGPSSRTVACQTDPCATSCVDPHDGLDPLCCERVWPVNSDVNRYTIVTGSGCKMYHHEALGNANVPARNKPCPSGKLFNTRKCDCDDAANVTCRDQSSPPPDPCADPHDGLNPACCERVWPVNDDVNRYTPVPGTNCAEYKHEALFNANVPPVIRNCPATSWFNTKKCDCDYGPLVDCRE